MADSPVSINTPGAPSEAPSGPSPQEQKQMEQAYAQMKRKMAMEEIGRNIKHKIMARVVLANPPSQPDLLCPSLSKVTRLAFWTLTSPAQTCLK